MLTRPFPKRAPLTEGPFYAGVPRIIGAALLACDKRMDRLPISSDLQREEIVFAYLSGAGCVLNEAGTLRNDLDMCDAGYDLMGVVAKVSSGRLQRLRTKIAETWKQQDAVGDNTPPYTEAMRELTAADVCQLHLHVVDLCVSTSNSMHPDGKEVGTYRMAFMLGAFDGAQMGVGLRRDAGLEQAAALFIDCMKQIDKAANGPHMTGCRSSLTRRLAAVVG